MRQLVDATQIDQWFVSTRRDAQELLPHLVRKLILATVDRDTLSLLRIPAGDSIRLPGYDGQVHISSQHPYVPMGRSVWEMGCGDPRDKADKDYQKRTKNPGSAEPANSVIVMVSPHPFDGKDAWVEKCSDTGPWADVRFIDGEDLAAWLEMAPAVARWLGQQMGIPMAGLRTAEEFWAEEIDAAYGVQIPVELVIGGRDEEIKKVHQWFQSDLRELRVEAEAEEEAAAFIAASVKSLPDDIRESVHSRLLFVGLPDAIDAVAGLRSTHFVVGTAIDTKRRARARHQADIRLLTPISTATVGQDIKPPVCKLGRIRRQACEKSLAGMGVSRERAHRIALESKGRLAPVLWMLAEELDRPPAWAQGPAALELLPLVLAGQWLHESPTDRSAVEQLSGRSYAEVNQSCVNWLWPRGPLVRRGPAWDWLAWDFAWVRLGRFMDQDRVNSFAEVVVAVLGQPDPSLELAPDERWTADIRGKKHPYSTQLRSGLVESLVQFAINDLPSGLDGQGFAERLVRRLLDGKDVPRKLSWPSLAPWLSELAEAAPDGFLTCVDGLAANEEAISALFLSTSEPLFGSHPHVYLLWALERLAWSRDYLARATMALGQLAAIEPGVKLINRPANSLTEIFLPWHPQTQATVAQRIGAIDALYGRLPGVAWTLGVSLLPGKVMATGQTSEPKWRPWKPSDPSKSREDEFWGFTEQLVDRMLAWAGGLGERWMAIIEAYRHIRGRHPDLADRVMQAVLRLRPDDLSKDDRVTLWESLRKLLTFHREHEDTEWAMRAAELQPLDELLQRFQPDDPVALYGWLFTAWPDLPRSRDLTFEQEQSRIQDERKKIVMELHRAGGLKAILDFAAAVEHPDAVGFAAAGLPLTQDDEAKLFDEALAERPTNEGYPVRLRLAIGYVWTRYRIGKDQWLERLLKAEGIAWDASKYANLGLGLPPTTATWDRLSKLDPQAERLYWMRTSTSFPERPEDVERAVRSLLDVGRHYRALNVASMSVRSTRRAKQDEQSAPLSTDLIRKVLEVPTQEPGRELFAPAVSGIGHDVELLIDVLELREVSLSDLASLEWAWMPALRHGGRGLKALQRALSNEPDLFVDLMKIVFRGEGEEPKEISEEEKARGTQAFQLLEEWKRVPGLVEEIRGEGKEEGDIVFPRGRVDRTELFRWVQRARDMAREAGRQSVSDSRIGQVLAYSPADPDGRWPCEPVRDLIEELGSEDVERGLAIGVYNKRGAHWRVPGGQQERDLAARFRNWADQVRRWPRTASTINRIAEHYMQEAKWEDEREELEEFE